MPVDNIRKHDQLHKVLDNEEVIELEHKGTVAKYKLDHASKELFIEGGPEEDCAWKKTNGSYADAIQRLGRQPASPSIPSGIESDKAVDMESVGVPGFEVPVAPEASAESL